MLFSERYVEEVKINVSCAIDSTQTVVPVNANEYFGKVLDLNNDGLNDIYIQKKINGRVGDFYLRQSANAKFDLVTTLCQEIIIQDNFLRPLTAG